MLNLDVSWRWTPKLLEEVWKSFLEAINESLEESTKKKQVRLWSKNLDWWSAEIGRIGARIDGGGRNPVAAAVAWKEAHPDMTDPAAQYFIGRLAPGRLYRNPLGLLECVDGIEPRPPDDADGPLAHETPLPKALVQKITGGGWRALCPEIYRAMISALIGEHKRDRPSK